MKSTEPLLQQTEELFKPKPNQNQTKKAKPSQRQGTSFLMCCLFRGKDEFELFEEQVTISDQTLK